MTDDLLDGLTPTQIDELLLVVFGHRVECELLNNPTGVEVARARIDHLLERRTAATRQTDRQTR